MKIIFRITVAAVMLLGGIAEAQQPAKQIPRIGFISSTSDPSPFDAFRQGLYDLGYVDGKNVVIVHRHAEGRLDRMPTFVREFVQQKVDVIMGVNNVVIQAAKEATKTIPTVMISSIDPVAAGYVESFARPGGNITGFAWLLRDLSAKRVELLKEVLPEMSRVGVLWDTDGPGPAVALKEYEEAARAFKLDLHSVQVRGPTPDLLEAFQVAKPARLDALIVVGNPLMSQHKKEVFELATKNRLPSMTEALHYVEAGGLMSYGANRADLFHRAAIYVDKILKGAKPADLPVMLPTRFEIFINLKTAKQIGIVIPQHMLARADKLIK